MIREWEELKKAQRSDISTGDTNQREDMWGYKPQYTANTHFGIKKSQESFEDFTMWLQQRVCISSW